MRIAICDDEPVFADGLREHLSEYAQQNEASFEIDVFYASTELWKNFLRGSYHLVFLDISMPEMDGMELAKRIRESDSDVKIVFVTVVSDYVFQSFKVEASDFIVKPYHEATVCELMDRLIVQEKHQEPTLEVKIVNHERRLLEITTLRYIRSAGHYLKAYTDAEPEIGIPFLGKMEDMALRLSPLGFVRIHQSYIVNTLYIWTFSDKHVSLKTGEILDFSRRYHKTARKEIRERRGLS